MPDPSVPPPLRVREADSVPNLIPVYELIISGGTLSRVGATGAQILVDSGAAAAVTYAATGNQYVTLALAADLTAERVLTASTGITLTDVGANDNVLVSVNLNPRRKTAGFFAGGNLSTTHVAEQSRIRIPFNMTPTRVDLAVTTSATGASIIVDINQYSAAVGVGTSMFAAQADQPFIPASFNAGSATSFNAIGTLYAGSFMGFDIDQVGSTVVGSNLTITVLAESS